MRHPIIRLLVWCAVALSLGSGTGLAAGLGLPQGTWKLRSQRNVSGEPPSFPPGLVMSLDGAGKPAHLNAPVPASIVGRDRMKFTVSADGRVLTQEARGVHEKTGKLYRYVLTWDKQ